MHIEISRSLKSKRIWLSIVLVSVTTVLACAAPIRAHTYTADSSDTLTVLVYNLVGMPEHVLQAGERQADKILSVAGAKVEWVLCPTGTALSSSEPCRNGWSAQTPGLRFVTGMYTRQPLAFAYSEIPVRITVYYEEIVRMSRNQFGEMETPVILGSIIAHELGHVLLGSLAHSSIGIMQPRWTKKQIYDALTGGLFFTKEQAARIQSRAHTLASLRRTERNPIPQ